MWQLVIPGQCTSKHDLCVSPQVSLSGCSGGLRHVCWLPQRPRVDKKVSDSCGGVRVEGREEELTCSNETLLPVSALHHLTKWKLHERAAYVRCLVFAVQSAGPRVTFKPACGVGRGWASTAATSCDNNVTVNLGLRRQCGWPSAAAHNLSVNNIP